MTNLKKYCLGFEYVVDETGVYAKINRCHPVIWGIFLMDLIFGPFVMMFCKRYTFAEYKKELKSILKGRYSYSGAVFKAGEYDFVEEDDYTLDWEEFHKLHPDVPKEEYEMGVKSYQEM